MNKLILAILVWAIVSFALSIGIATAIFDVNAAPTITKEVITFQEYPTLVKCYDYKTRLMHDPVNNSCMIGKTMKNVWLPSASQMRLIKEVFHNRKDMYVPLAIINKESQFDVNARSCNKFACASGIMQITDVNGGKRMDSKEQLQWFKDRKAHQLSVGTCSKTAKSGNHEKLIRCVFARHFGDLDFYGKYANEGMDMYRFYENLLEGKELVF